MNSPFVIGDETYWLVLNDTLKEKGEKWDYDAAEPPPLLPNEVIKITRDILSEQRIANLQWKIIGVNLKQLTQTNDDTQFAYSYYEVELMESLQPSTPEWNKRIESGNTTLEEILIIVKMDGDAVLPEKGKHLKDMLSPELWEKYKLRHGIE